ncbi:FliM/FliN family flagellar motor switch protein [Chelativorans sp. Marseille-P2723]|uniref:FliM/FliN family flagellar motor switch protein n=1 Tax=Chelativorans sp. Marseille-P2723 TaxID=2709133 RepID=UPI001570875D|nr:FliM/FliN family flagellar motor switch protein [Chelativorans sp. Marseille-P2723]
MNALVNDPEKMREFVVERLVGATGDPRLVTEAARNIATRALPLVQETFQERYSASLLVEVSDIENVRLAELRPEPDSLDALVVVPSGTSRDALTMRLDARALSLLVNVILGGDPDIPPLPANRPPSRIEMDVAALVFGAFAQALNGTGDRSLGLRLPVPQPLAGPSDFKQLIVRDGPGVRIDFSIGVGALTGSLTAWIPHRVILETRVQGVRTSGDTPPPAQWQQRFSEEVRRSKVQVTATIPLMKVALGKLADLKLGQVLELKESAPKETRISVRNRPIFICEFGRLGQNYTVRITKPFDDRKAIIEGLLAD